MASCGGNASENQSFTAPAGKGAAPNASQQGKVSRDNPCSVLFPTEVADILGVPVEMREIVDEVTCRYHFEAGRRTRAEDSGGETFVEVKTHWTGGRVAVTATRLAGQLLGSDKNAFEELTGVGDEAWLAPMASYLVLVKGDVGIEIDLRLLPGERDKAIRLAQLIASRL